LWADAVCIDQSNVHERTEQVAMMGAIYSGASCTLVWLSEEVNGSDGAVCMDFFAKRPNLHKTHPLQSIVMLYNATLKRKHRRSQNLDTNDPALPGATVLHM
jgi:hypothetical protein